jgi:hypothetical protein
VIPLFLYSQNLKKLILSCVGLTITRTIKDVHNFLRRTLMHVQRETLQLDVMDLGSRAVEVQAFLGEGGVLSLLSIGGAMIRLTLNG